MINRRSFMKAIAALPFVGLADIAPPVISAGTSPIIPAYYGWRVQWAIRVLNDGPCYVMRGPPDELQEIYEEMKKQHPELC